MAESLGTYWVLARVGKTGFEVIYTFGKTARHAYELAGELMGHPAYSAKQLKEMGYQAVEVNLNLVRPVK